MHLFDQLLGKVEPLWFENSTNGRDGTFDAVALCEGKRIAVLGTTVAREGIAFVSTVEVHGREIPLTFTIRRRSIPSRVKIVKAERMQAPKRVVHRYFCSFTAIAADDWDAVVRYVENMPEPRAVPLPVLVDDECRSLTSAVQEKIVDHLVRLKRLAKPASGVAPLIRLQAGPVQELEDGRSARDVRIHSRVLADDRFRSYDTRFRVYSDESVELVLS
jgi:hypothetical protein